MHMEFVDRHKEQKRLNAAPSLATSLQKSSATNARKLPPNKRARQLPEQQHFSQNGLVEINQAILLISLNYSNLCGTQQNA